MRALGWFSLILVTASFVGGCGGGADGGPPGTASNMPVSGSEPEPEAPTEPAVGSCQKLCCSNADCGAGKTCTPFQSASGTLGICSGFDEASSADPPAGATLPSSCWSLNAAGCNGLTSEGCDAGDACDFADGSGGVEAVVSCFGGDNTQGSGESCDNALGPWCQPGFHCVTAP